MARLYADENVPLQLVEGLRALGHDVLTTREAGQAGQGVPDSDVLAYAADRNRAVLTLNRRRFIRLHNQQSAHSGVIVCTFDPDFAAQAARIHTLLELQPDLTCQLIRINRPA